VTVAVAGWQQCDSGSGRVAVGQGGSGWVAVVGQWQWMGGSSGTVAVAGWQWDRVAVAGWQCDSGSGRVAVV
jgi:hypothetical protein